MSQDVSKAKSFGPNVVKLYYSKMLVNKIFTQKKIERKIINISWDR